MGFPTSFLLIVGLISTVVARSLSPNAVSTPEAPCLSASGDSFLPLLSGDGRYIVFFSSAKNLVRNQTLAPHLNLFRHDLVTGETTLLLNGVYADFRAPSVCSNGHTIAFGDGTNVYVIDANSGVRSLVSVDLNGNSPPNHFGARNVPLSDKPFISDDGRWVAFESFATNLTAETDLNNDSDVFLRDAMSNRTTLISVAHPGGTTANQKSEIMAISADGNLVLFRSPASNLVTNYFPYRHEELYIRDMAAGTTSWIPDPESAPHRCAWAFISRDGRFVLFKVGFTPGTSGKVFLHDRYTASNVVVSASSRENFPVHMTSDGRFIAYDEYGWVYLRDRQTGVRTSVTAGGTPCAPLVSQDGSIVTFLNTASSIHQLYYSAMTTNQPRPLTRTLVGALSRKDHLSASVAIAPGGEFIVFDSAEDNLVADDHNRANDIFIHFVATGETRLISRADADTPSFTPVSDATVTNHCVSADGTRILFFSTDSNLVPGDTNSWQDAFVRDLSTGRTSALSTNADGRFSPTNSVPHGVLSANGRFALLGVFNLPVHVEVLPAPSVTILRKDLDTGESIPIVSNLLANTGYMWPAPNAALSFSISCDGRWVTYPSNNNIIVADMQVGVQTNLTPSDPNWTAPVISGDGRYVTYGGIGNRAGSLLIADLSTAERSVISTNYLRGAAFSLNSEHLVYSATEGSVYVYAPATHLNTLVCSNCANASPSGDARFVAYEKVSSGARQIELKEIASGKTTTVTRSVNGLGGGNRDATWPVISADGRYIAYTSKATNLTTDVPNGWNNLYVYDRIQGTTIRITGSRGNTGYGSGSASQPVLGPDGRTLVFQSFASDFVQNDFNDTRDIFLLKLGGDDSDNDGMPDDWEQTHFSTTDRDGSGDFDQDGQSDLAEYLAGTNPNNAQSVLEVLQITFVNTGERHLIWRAEPGKSYRLEYKTDLDGAAWTSLGQIITATGPSASAIDPTAVTEKRFYRVALVQ